MVKIIVTISVLAIVAIGIFYLVSNPQSNSNSALLNQSSETNNSSQPKKIEGFSGNLLAGNTSPFLEFNKADYEKAKSDGKIIVLDFYANWCPICRVEEPEIFAGFNELNNPNVVGFRVNFNDSDTDSDEQALAAEFNIPYQHTKIVIKNGAEVFRSTTQWKKEDLINSVNAGLN